MSKIYIRWREPQQRYAVVTKPVILGANQHQIRDHAAAVAYAQSLAETHNRPVIDETDQ